MQGTATQNAPSAKLVLYHFIFACFSWLFVVVLLNLNPSCLQQHYFNAQLLAITHYFVLNFVSLIIFGALYQLIPVIFLVKLYSEKLAYFSLFLVVLGTFGLFFSFWNNNFSFPLIISGFFIFIAATIFVINLLLTVKKSTKKNIEKTFILSSSIWFLLTVFLGLILAINFIYPFISISHIEFLKIHVHVGLIGWFLQLIIGVSSVLIPMFLISHNLNKNKLKITFIVLNIALILGIFSQYFSYTILIKCAFLLGAISIVFYIYFIILAFLKRVKKKIDLGMKKSLFSFLLLIFTLILSLIISFFNVAEVSLSITYIVTFLLGFVSTLILGQTYKTLPFIVWLKEYKSFVGKEKTPLPKDLFSEKILNFQIWFHLLGICLLLLSILFNGTKFIQISLLLILFAAILYFINVLKIVLHKRKIKNEKSN
jgi:cbb3-type cytochrome oxidase subunit 1